MSDTTFVFYDLETSGLSARSDRIMQLAAIRTDVDLNPIGKPYNFLIRLSEDVLPSPQAINVTGITPQKTVEEGYSEAEACDIILNEIFTPNTVATGYNSVRFDDEFIRHLFWRNLRDPYEWAYKDGRSRWDLLDVVRFKRAVRPGKITWPVDDDGKPSNRLELISSANKLEHAHAHDALSDVEALIGVGKLIKQSDHKLWEYLFKMRDKKLVQQLVNLDRPEVFVYSSGRLESEFEKTTLAYPIFECKNNNIMVYNLRYNPEDLLGKSPTELAEFLAKYSKSTNVKSLTDNEEIDSEAKEGGALPDRRVYFKTLRYNRCPAVAPVGVMRADDFTRIKLDLKTAKKHLSILKKHPELIETIKNLSNLKERQLEKPSDEDLQRPAEERLYDDFLPDSDRRVCQKIIKMTPSEMKTFKPDFTDGRLLDLFLSYKAHSFPSTLDKNEVYDWEAIKIARLQKQLPIFMQELEELSKTGGDEFVVGELKYWLENILPSE